MNTYLMLLQTAAKTGKYTSHRSEVISYILIILCAAAFLYLVIRQIKSHK